MTLDQARRDLTKELLIRIPYGDDEEAVGKIDLLKAVLPTYKGSCPVWLVVRDRNGKLARMKLPAEYGVNPAALKVDELDKFLGRGAALFNGR
jgi:DNA polymerase-3 subunit alpha